MPREARRNFRLTSLNLEEINFCFGLLMDRIDELEGRRGTPQFKSNIDMGSNKVTQMQSGTAGSDGATVIQVEGVQSDLDDVTGGTAGLVATATPASNRIVMSPSGSQYLNAGWLSKSMLVWDKTLTGAATTVTTNGEVMLDGLAHGGYNFEFVVLNNSGSTSRYRLYYENDTTNANYNYHTIYSTAASASGSYGNEAYLDSVGLATADVMIFSGLITITQAGLIVTRSINISHGAVDLEIYAHKKISAVTNLTRIDLTASVASAINTNSRFRLWRII